MLIALLNGALYAGVGVLLLGLGFVVFDLITPGRLGRHIYEKRSLNAALITSAVFLGLGAIQATAIYVNGAAHVWTALGWTVAFGVLGIALQAAAFLGLDALTPGSLREIAVDDRFHPGALVAAAATLAVSLVICVSITP